MTERNGPSGPSGPSGPGGQDPRAVVVLPADKPGQKPGHEVATHLALAQHLAAIMGCEFGGRYDAAKPYGGGLYFVPGDTLADPDTARRLGIRDDDSLFGGVVPFPFVATKAITHPLPDRDARAPAGWSHRFPQEVASVVLPGFTAYATDDALGAGLRLLAQGPVRVKLASGVGGLGQWVVEDEEALRDCLAALDPEELARCGLVCERNLDSVRTVSVGQVKVGALLATYYGTQRLTVNNSGEEVYGGSELTICRGGFDELLRAVASPEMRLAVVQARVYHAAALSAFEGMFASRCNYDIAQGVDPKGDALSGVLEQSWRIGGASGAELIALDAFRQDPSVTLVRASTTEVYGAAPELPGDAMIYFSGTDERVGPITKYARMEEHGNS